MREDELQNCPNCGTQTLSLFAWSGPACVWRCGTCEYEEQRAARDEDTSKLQRLLYPTPDENHHRVYHAFRDEFQDEVGNWRWRGFELIQRVQEWALAFPDDVSLVGCDDARHTSSLLVLVQHKRRSDGDFMGTSVVFVAQAADDEPTEFFLYPEHQNQLMRTLAAINDARGKLKSES